MGFAQGEEKMSEYQIEATIEKFSQDSVELKGAGEYLFEKLSKKKKDDDKEYCNIFELKPDKKFPIEQYEEPSIELKSVKCDEPIDFAEFKDLLVPAFIEKKSLKFTLKCENNKFTITAISHAST